MDLMLHIKYLDESASESAKEHKRRVYTIFRLVKIQLLNPTALLFKG